MHKSVVAGAVFVFTVALGAATNRAEAMPAAPRAEVLPPASDVGAMQEVRYACRCARQWPARQYWQWDSRPIWDDPWRVLKPNFWGSPEPHLVPADIWARKWHLPGVHHWRLHHQR
jgi:hypothetical protein